MTPTGTHAALIGDRHLDILIDEDGAPVLLQTAQMPSRSKAGRVHIALAVTDSNGEPVGLIDEPLAYEPN